MRTGRSSRWSRAVLGLAALALCSAAPAVLAARPAARIPAVPPGIGTYFRATFGVLQGQEAVVTLPGGEVVNAVVPEGGPTYRAGEQVIVWSSGGEYVVQDAVRTPGLGWLLTLLLLLAAALGRWKGVRAVVGAAVSLAVLVWVIVPQLARQGSTQPGTDALPTVLLGTAAILSVTIYFVHGLSRKTSAALIGTALSTVLGLGLAVVAARALHFTGTVTEGGYVASTLFGLNPLSVYLVGIVVGTVGALNDVTVTQAAVVQALAHENPGLKAAGLYRRAMQVGFDHIGSLINVLVLLYAASSLPLLLLLSRDPAPWWVKLSGEGFASEVTSILISTVCLLLAVPLTTLMAARLFRGGRYGAGEGGHVH